MEIVPVVQLDRSVLKDDEWLKNIKAVGRRVEELYKMKLFLLLVLVFSFVVDAMPMFGSLSVRTSVKAKISAQNGDVSAKEVEQRAVKSTDLNEGIQLKGILKVKEQTTSGPSYGPFFKVDPETQEHAKALSIKRKNDRKEHSRAVLHVANQNNAASNLKSSSPSLYNEVKIKSKKRITLNEEKNQVKIIPNREDIATEAHQQRIIEHWRDVLPIANQNNAASKLKTSSPSISKEVEVKSKKRVTLNEKENQVMTIPNIDDIAKENRQQLFDLVNSQKNPEKTGKLKTSSPSLPKEVEVKNIISNDHRNEPIFETPKREEVAGKKYYIKNRRITRVSSNTEKNIDDIAMETRQQRFDLLGNSQKNPEKIDDLN